MHGTQHNINLAPGRRAGCALVGGVFVEQRHDN